MRMKIGGRLLQDDRVRVGIEKFLDRLTPCLQPSRRYSWVGKDQDQFWEFLRRGAIVRQDEALRAAIKMFDVGVGHFAVTLVRPAYEELVWIEYLYKHSDWAHELAHLLGVAEIRDNLEAQNEYLGAKAMQSQGFTQKFVKSYLAKSRKDDARLREIARSLRWGRDGSKLPTFGWLARQVGREREYKFLYQGTSRHVHFSSTEIYRRVWGKKGEVTIGSDSFARYWSDFALYWLFRIFLDVLSACQDVLGDAELTDEEGGEMIDWLADLVPIPIITAAELESWNEPVRPKGAKNPPQ